MQEDQLGQETWDKKKVGVFLVIIIALIAGGIYVKMKYFGGLQQQSLIPFKSSQSVEGISTESNGSKDSSSSIPDNIKNNVQQKLDSIKQQITNLNPVDVATSSPQVQKIINDFKSLEQYPSNQAKEMCQKVCSSL